MRANPAIRSQWSPWHLHAKVKASAFAYVLSLVCLAAIDHLMFPLPPYVIGAAPGALMVATGYTVRTGPEDV